MPFELLVDHFDPVSLKHIDKIQGSVKATTCTLDLWPFGLLKSCKNHINKLLGLCKAGNSTEEGDQDDFGNWSAFLMRKVFRVFF